MLAAMLIFGLVICGAISFVTLGCVARDWARSVHDHAGRFVAYRTMALWQACTLTGLARASLLLPLPFLKLFLHAPVTDLVIAEPIIVTRSAFQGLSLSE